MTILINNNLNQGWDTKRTATTKHAESETQSYLTDEKYKFEAVSLYISGSPDHPLVSSVGPKLMKNIQIKPHTCGYYTYQDKNKNEVIRTKE